MSAFYCWRFLLQRRTTRSYLVLALIFVYICLMYRILESMCLETGRREYDKFGGVYVPTEARTRKIMQLDFQNTSGVLMQLALAYENVERQRKFLVDKIQKTMESGADENGIGEQFIGSGGRINARNAQTSHLVSQGSGIGSFRYLPRNQKYMFNCTNVHEIKLKNKIGHGVSKQTFIGDYNGLSVAVKMVTRHQSEVKDCLDKLTTEDQTKEEFRSKCFVFSNMKMMKEILLLEQLEHPGFARLLGYCIRSEESDTSDLLERGVVSIFELGERFTINNVQLLTWQERILHAMSLANFLNYLEYSPLGSLRVRDFKEGHFLLFNSSQLKMIDLDDVDNLEPSCSTYVAIDSNFPKLDGTSDNKGCEFGLVCQKGLCIGFNAKQNMKFMNKLFFKRLLFPIVFPKQISSEIGTLIAAIDSYEISAADLYLSLNKLLNIGW